MSWKMRYFILGPDNAVVEVDGSMAVAMGMEGVNSKVGSSRIGPLQVCTDFFPSGFKMSQPGEPMLFETMIFGDLPDGLDPEAADALGQFINIAKHYPTWAQALEEHNRLCTEISEVYEALLKIYPGLEDLCTRKRSQTSTHDFDSGPN